ncbi:MAG: glycine/betaine/sarcosine/D-proline family reductase selenoprotein B, partial [Chloroflexi bacterium]|nr:glycine/betaine/sarcosine/D-proline family reductase selenoprotein B [Chloroflexota bacterium]
MSMIRVAHYVNQFFGGVGGEKEADLRPRTVEGPVGAGRALQSALGDRGEVVVTVICGDNYVAENTAQASEEVVELLSPYRVDVVIAGPAFASGRYGIACGAVCRAVQEKLRIPAVTGMHELNPGVDLCSRRVYIVRTEETVAGMAGALSGLVKIASRLAAGQSLGSPAEEGYFSRGMLVNVLAEETGAERVVAMLLAKL